MAQPGSKSVLFVQGGGKDVHAAWDNRLVASLERELGSGYAVRYPRMPDEANPKPAPWKEAIGRELRQLGEGTVLVGHSVGAAILLDYLADGDGRQVTPAGVFLIAPPFIGDGGWPSDELRPTKRAAASLPKGVPIHLYQGRDDETVPVAHVGMFAKVLPDAKIRTLDGRDHQLNDDLSEVARDIQRLTAA
jgi:predicted alpha/beta hydrolase family esterase